MYYLLPELNQTPSFPPNFPVSSLFCCPYRLSSSNMPFMLSYVLPNRFPGSSDGKESAYNAGDPGLILGLGRCPGEGKGNSLQYSCLKNPMDRGAWRAIVHGVTKSRTQLSN